MILSAKQGVAAAKLKDEGNALLGQKDYAGAESKYSAALELDETPALLSNRALVRYLQENYAGSLADAEKCIELDHSWLKGHFHRVRALTALERYDEAQRAHSVGLENGGQDNADFLKLAESVAKNYISVHYDKLTENMPVKVQYMDRERGKGLVAKKAVRMFQPVFSEEPLVSHRKLESAVDACSLCLRFFLSRQQIESTKLAPFCDDVYPSIPQWIYCRHCETRAHEMTQNDPKLVVDPFLRGNPFFLEKYCSEACRDNAFVLYHQCLCGASFVSDEKKVHPLHHLYNLCVESNQTNPLLICRIFAMTFQRVVSQKMSVEEAFQDFRNFVSSEVVTGIDEMAVFLLKNMWAPFPFMDQLITLSTYRRLNSAILRNAQTVTPVSDLHAWFEAALKDEARYPNLMERLGFTADALKNYMAGPEMLSLKGASGTALLPVANCMNHSCDPNVIASSSHNNHTATFVALRPIEAGEELCISYVDDNLTWEERQKLLRDYYQFDCKCIRCHVQKEKLKIYE